MRKSCFSKLKVAEADYRQEWIAVGGLTLKNTATAIKKPLLLLLFIIAIFVFHAKAQHAPSQLKWPVPTDVPGLLFYLQRDPDINTVCYTVNFSEDGKPDPEEPIEIFWMRYAADGKKRKLNSLQRQFGYGLSFTRITADSFVVKAVIFPNRTMHLFKNEDNKYVIKMKISEQLCELKRVYIRIIGGTAISPEIEYVEFHGQPLTGRQLVTERVNLR